MCLQNKVREVSSIESHFNGHWQARVCLKEDDKDGNWYEEKNTKNAYKNEGYLFQRRRHDYILHKLNGLSSQRTDLFYITRWKKQD